MVSSSSSHSFRVLLAATALLLAPTWFNAAQASIRTVAIVTVYSNGQVMTTYNAINYGFMDNGCYVFLIRKGVRELGVRVCGCFTVEQVR